MFKLFIFLFTYTAYASSIPDGRLLSNEFEKIFKPVVTKGQYFKLFLSLHDIFKPGCLSPFEVIPPLEACPLESLSIRANNLPNHTLLYDAGLSNFCIDIASRMTQNNLSLRGLNPISYDEVQTIVDSFYYDRSDNSEISKLLFESVSELSVLQQYETVYLTLCLDPGWLAY